MLEIIGCKNYVRISAIFSNQFQEYTYKYICSGFLEIVVC